MMTFILSMLFGLLCYRLGWESAHKTVADECERLGGFYVGDKIFKCFQVDDRRYTPPSQKPPKRNPSAPPVEEWGGSNPLPENIPRPAPPQPPPARSGRHL